MTNYNIQNEPIIVSRCAHCGNEVQNNQLLFIVVPGLKSNCVCNGLGQDYLNSLMVLDKISNCCEHPNYS